MKLLKHGHHHYNLCQHAQSSSSLQHKVYEYNIYKVWKNKQKNLSFTVAIKTYPYVRYYRIDMKKVPFFPHIKVHAGSQKSSPPPPPFSVFLDVRLRDIVQAKLSGRDRKVARGKKEKGYRRNTLTQADSP